MSPRSLTKEENSPTSDEEQFWTSWSVYPHCIKEKENTISRLTRQGMWEKVFCGSQTRRGSFLLKRKCSLELDGLFMKDEDNFLSYFVQDEEILKIYLNDHDLFF